jgi:TPR repeat protein
MSRFKFFAPGMPGWGAYLPCFGLLLVAMNAMAAKPQQPEVKDITPMQGIMVPTKEYSAVVQQALAGSGEAAHRLATQFVMTGRISEAIFWATIAAENGHQGGMFNLGYQLSQSRDPKQRVRARFWLNKLVLSGNKDMRERAQDVLRTLDENERTNAANTAPRYGEYPKWPTD